MSTTVGEFVLNLVVDAGKGELTVGNLVAQMGQLEVASVGEIAVLTELAKTLVSITEASMHTALGLSLFSKETGGSSEELEKWEAVARHTIKGADGLAASFLSVSTQIEDIQKFGQQAPIVNALGMLKDVNFKGLKPEDPFELIRRIRGSKIFQGKSQADQFGILRHAGLENFIELLTMSKTKFDKFYGEAGTYSEREKKKYEEIHDQLATVENTAIRIRKVIADWFSEATLAGLKEIGKLLQLEYDSLVQIKAYSDSVKSGKNEGLQLKYVIPAIKDELFESIGDAVKDFLIKSWNGPLGGPLSEGVVPPSNSSSPSSSTHKTEVHAPVKVSISGSKLSAAELAYAVQEGISKALQPAVAQLDIGVTA